MSWTHDQVVDEVRNVILDHVETSTSITEQTELVADLGIDSLGVMEVVADIEDKFERAGLAFDYFTAVEPDVTRCGLARGEKIFLGVKPGTVKGDMTHG